MHCEHLKIDGVDVIICGGPRPKRQNCESCGAPNPTIQCDYPVRRRPSKDPRDSRPLVKGTCDRWICGQCATQVGPDVHYCRPHAQTPLKF